MTKNNAGHITLPELLILAALSVLVAWLLQHEIPHHASEEAQTAQELASGESVCAEIPWDEDALTADLTARLAVRESPIRFSYDCADVLFDVFYRVLDAHPEFFWLTGKAAYVKHINGPAVEVEFTPEILLSEEEILRRSEALEARRAEIVSRLNAVGAPYEQLLVLHDLLVDEVEYDSAVAALIGQEDGRSYSASDAYGCLVERRAVCSGYAAAFQLIASDLGIPCLRVRGADLENGVEHEWNLARIDDVWTHIDVTWDDPVFAGETVEGYRTYDYFCVTDEEIARTHRISEDQTLPACTSRRYNYYRLNGMEQEVYDFAAASGILVRQIGNPYLLLKFPGTEELNRAVADLIDNQAIFSIPEIEASGAASLRYVASEAGTLFLVLLP